MFTAQKENTVGFQIQSDIQYTYGSRPSRNNYNNSRQENRRTLSASTANNFPDPQFYPSKTRNSNVYKSREYLPTSKPSAKPFSLSPLKTIKENVILQQTEGKTEEEEEALAVMATCTNRFNTNHSVPTRTITKKAGDEPSSHSKYVRSNVSMSLWTISELKTYLNRNNYRIPLHHNRDKSYYYRLAAVHQKLHENRQLEQKVRSLSQMIDTKDALLHKYQSLQNGANSNHDMNQNQFNKLMQLQQEIRSLKQQNQTLRRENEMHSNTIKKQKHEMQQIQTQKQDDMSQQNQRFENEMHCHKQQMMQLQDRCKWYQQKARSDEETRKRLHNTIQELKGNIRVFCRLRPLFQKQESVFQIGNDIETDSITLLHHISGKANKTKRYNFAFDRVFGPSADQPTVFREISELVQSALDGYKVCIFAYGQTGSGKTFTMNGASSNAQDSNRGMIPRSMEQIFKYKQALQQKGWEYKCTVSYLEIYNETIRDLLVKNNSNNQNNNHYKYSFRSYWNGNRNVNETKSLEIHQKRTRNGSTQVYVDGLKEIEVSSSSDVYSLLRLASKNRSVGRTDCNERSSRSHTVFQLFLKGQNAMNGETTVGVLNLIDLAGSERLKNSSATGMQLKETQNINKSLSCLGDVIAALSTKKGGHIPYRNSKLTYLLMNYFGGDAKTLMFVNLCPEKEKTHESLCSLRFAAKVNDCELGAAKKTIYK